MTPPDSGLWAFSIERYGRPGVAGDCLRLQDEAGADVNVVLACLWCGRRGVAVGRADMAALGSGAAADWHDRVVRPLRAARRAMKRPPPGLSPDAVEALRTRLKAVELETERWEQSLLEAALAPLPAAAVPGRGLAMANLALYAETLGAAVPPDLLEGLVRRCVD